jgi:hypothetical protein
MKIYNCLRAFISLRKIRYFIEELIHPHFVKQDMFTAYKKMSYDRAREAQALKWSEATIGDIINLLE